MDATQRGRGLAVAVAFTLIGQAASFGLPNGLSAAFNGGPSSGFEDCTACHVPVTVGAGSVQILGAPSAYLVNQLYNLTVRVEDPDQVGAGYQLSVEDAQGNSEAPFGGGDRYVDAPFSHIQPQNARHGRDIIGGSRCGGRGLVGGSGCRAAARQRLAGLDRRSRLALHTGVTRPRATL